MNGGDVQRSLTGSGYIAEGRTVSQLLPPPAALTAAPPEPAPAPEVAEAE